MTDAPILTRREIAHALKKRQDAERRKAAKAARPKSPKASRGRERNNAYLAWLRRQPCVARHMGGCDGPVEAWPHQNAGPVQGQTPHRHGREAR
jgi:hypothetical protein